MSMELHVLSDRRLNNSAEWQKAINAASYPVQLSDGLNFTSMNGFQPVMLSGRQSGFECLHDDASSTMEFLGRAIFSHRWKYALGLRWRGTSLDELQAAWMAGAAYANATGGVIFDHETGKVLNLPEARKAVDEIVRNAPAIAQSLAAIRNQLEA